MTETLTLTLPTLVGPPTSILVGAGALERALGSGHGPEGQLAPWLAGRTVFLITSPTVRRFQGTWVERALSRHAARLVVLEVPDGEAAKNLVTAGKLWQALLDAGGKRDSRLVTLGGGTVGDLGGFVAGCFLRGIEYVQMPTTLLAQVDAAVGGKTGIDMPGTKNSVGLFHHPAMVVSDAAFLATLPGEELKAALAEVVKVAIVLDPPLLERVERDLDALLEGDPVALGPVVTAAAGAKVAVVQRDPTEQGERRVLNLGHTLAHALEACLGYEGLRHGEAVAYGLLFCLRLAVARGLDPQVAERVRRLLARFDLPSLQTLPGAEKLHPEALLAAMARDKKARQTGLVWVLPTALGAWRPVDDIPMEAVRRELVRFLAQPL